jgi:hypothetical protein
MNYYNQFIKICDQWAKDYQKMPEGEEKIKMKAEMDKAIDWFYGKITIERVNDKDDKKSV